MIMKYIKKYKTFESLLTKNELVNKIKYLSNYLHEYLKDVNKFTNSNLNFNFSHDTELDIEEIFNLADCLYRDSPDGFITAIANEFIDQSNWFNKRRKKIYKKLETFKFDEDYENYNDEYKKSNIRELYDQDVQDLLYIYVGHSIKQMISGTIWDIPKEDKEFTEEDINFIFEALISDYDITKDYDYSYKLEDRNTKWEEKRGMIIKIPIIGNRYNSVKINNDSDFMFRLQSYFNGAIITKIIYGRLEYRIYLPFYKK